MAEALGITASIITVLRLAGAVATLGYDYIGGVKQASKNVREFISELHSLSQALIALQDYTDKNPQSVVLQRLNEKDGLLQECAEELKTLKSKLESRQTSEFKGVLNSLMWPLKERETAQLTTRIERHKSLLAFALTTDRM